MCEVHDDRIAPTKGDFELREFENNMRQTKIKRDIRCFSTQNDLMKTINENGVTLSNQEHFSYNISHMIFWLLLSKVFNAIES